jgi:hypothetical protein
MIVDEEVIKLIGDGISLNRINKLTGIHKSTLYYHYKKIHGRKYKKIYIDESDLEKVGEFIGIFTGDGNYTFDKKKYHHRIRIYTGAYESGYRKYLKSFLNGFFGKMPKTYMAAEGSVEVSVYNSRRMYDLIKRYLDWEGKKTYTVRLRNFGNLEKEFLIGFLKGLFDTDGGIYVPKKKVAFGTASKLLAYQVRDILRILGIDPGFYEYKNKLFWYIDLYGDRSEKFMKIVEPGNPNKILGARAGS